MVQRGISRHEAKTSSKSTDAAPSDVAAFNVMNVGMANVQSLFELQQQLVKRLQEFNRYQMEWAKKEADLASELAANVVEARSFPAVLSAWQEWNVRRVQSMTEESQKLVEESRDVATATMRLMSTGGRDAN